MLCIFVRTPANTDLVQAGLGVQLAEGGDNEWLGGSLCLHVGPVSWYRLGVRQRTDLQRLDCSVSSIYIIQEVATQLPIKIKFSDTTV